VVSSLFPEIEERYPTILDVTSSFGYTLGSVRADVDYFVGENLGEKRTYYVDMYVEEGIGVRNGAKSARS
jgi:hypothetical protein